MSTILHVVMINAFIKHYSKGGNETLIFKNEVHVRRDETQLVLGSFNKEYEFPLIPYGNFNSLVSDEDQEKKTVKMYDRLT